jgi:hypothetical protein
VLRHLGSSKILAVFGNLLVEGGQVGPRLAVPAGLALAERLAALVAGLQEHAFGGRANLLAARFELGEELAVGGAGHSDSDSTGITK